MAKIDEQYARNHTHNITLCTGALNDDYLEVLTGNLYYRGHNKAVCKVVYYTFATEWSNHEHSRYFTDTDRAIEWYAKTFKVRAIEQGRQYLQDWHDEDNTQPTGDEASEDDAMCEWQNITDECVYSAMCA